MFCSKCAKDRKYALAFQTFTQLQFDLSTAFDVAFHGGVAPYLGSFSASRARTRHKRRVQKECRWVCWNSNGKQCRFSSTSIWEPECYLRRLSRFPFHRYCWSTRWRRYVATATIHTSTRTEHSRNRAVCKRPVLSPSRSFAQRSIYPRGCILREGSAQSPATIECCTTVYWIGLWWTEHSRSRAVGSAPSFLPRAVLPDVLSTNEAAPFERRTHNLPRRLSDVSFARARLAFGRRTIRETQRSFARFGGGLASPIERGRENCWNDDAELHPSCFGVAHAANVQWIEGVCFCSSWF